MAYSINWVHAKVGGDEAAAGLVSYAEEKLTDSVYLSQVTSEYDVSINPA